MTVDIDPLDLVDPERYARDGYPHDVWTRLRAEAPVAHIEAPGYEPFWAVTKHADIMQIAVAAASGSRARRASRSRVPARRRCRRRRSS